MFRLFIEISGLPKMANQGLRGTHWAVKMQEARKWKKHVWLAVAGKKPIEPMKSARLSLTRYSAVEPDFDGLVSGFKHVIDGLVESGVLVSDKMSCIGQPKYHWEPTKRGKGKITIEVMAQTPRQTRTLARHAQTPQKTMHDTGETKELP